MLDFNTEYHRLNASKTWDRSRYEKVFGFDEVYAIVPSQEVHKVPI